MLGSDDQYFGSGLMPSREHRLGGIRMQVAADPMTDFGSGASGVGAETERVRRLLRPSR